MGSLTILFLVLTVLYFSFMILLFLAPGQQGLPSRSLIDYPVSVVVAARNARNNLAKLLEALNKQHYANFEVIIVDDRSNDETRDFLEEKKKEYSWLRSVHIETTPDKMDSKKYALTMGIKTARHDIILLTDSFLSKKEAFFNKA